MIKYLLSILSQIDVSRALFRSPSMRRRASFRWRTTATACRWRSTKSIRCMCPSW